MNSPGQRKNAAADANCVTIVVVDDDPVSAKMVAHALRKTDCRVEVFTDVEKCLAEFSESLADIVITDLRMPRIDGLGVLAEVKKKSPSTDVIIVTGDADKHAAIQALKLGAFDLLEKPVNGDELVETIKRTVRYRTVLRERDKLAEQLSFVAGREAKNWGAEALIGGSGAIRKVLQDIRSLQNADKTSVLIMGESGTGKELVARAIHLGSRRSSRPFAPVNCSAIPDNLAESVLFGHVRGAFTGAVADKKGAFDLADGGTLFMDEIGDMLPSIQAKLLRVLEDAVVQPVGAVKGHTVDVRIVAATNARLDRKIEAGTFRSDLYHRLATFVISIPPLRERKEDIPPLVEHFAAKLSSDMGMRSSGISSSAMEALAAYDYPGNVRELRNMIERALIRSGGREITAEHVQPVSVSAGAASASRGAPQTGFAADLPYGLDQLEKLAIKRAMEHTGGNVSAAAKLLGIGRTQLYRKLPLSGQDTAPDRGAAE